MIPIGSETLAVSTTVAVGLSTVEFNVMPGAASLARIQVEGSCVRYWEDGTLPTATSGNLLYPGDELSVFGGAPITTVRFIALVDAAVLQIAYWR